MSDNLLMPRKEVVIAWAGVAKYNQLTGVTLGMSRYILIKRSLSSMLILEILIHKIQCKAHNKTLFWLTDCTVAVKTSTWCYIWDPNRWGAHGRRKHTTPNNWGFWNRVLRLSFQAQSGDKIFLTFTCSVQTLKWLLLECCLVVSHSWDWKWPPNIVCGASAQAWSKSFPLAKQEEVEEDGFDRDIRIYKRWIPSKPRVRRTRQTDGEVKL